MRAQLPCEEFLWNADTPGEWLGKLEGLQEGLGFQETVKIFLDGRQEPPPLSPLNMALVLHGLISIGLDLQQRRSSPIGANPDDTASRQARLSRGFQIWRGNFESLMEQVLAPAINQKVLLMYHMAHIALHSNRQDLFTAAGDRRFFRRGSNDIYRAKQEVQEWAHLPSAQLATWHAVQILLSFFRSGAQICHQDFYASWSTYVATLMCWAYGQLSGSPLAGVDSEDVGERGWDLEREMGIYLQQMNTNSWEQLAHIRQQDRRRTNGLLVMVRDAFELARWGVIQEGMEVLGRLKSV